MHLINPSLLCDFHIILQFKDVDQRGCTIPPKLSYRPLLFLAMLPFSTPVNAKPLKRMHPNSKHQFSVHKTVAGAGERPSGTKGGKKPEYFQALLRNRHLVLLRTVMATVQHHHHYPAKQTKLNEQTKKKP